MKEDTKKKTRHYQNQISTKTQKLHQHAFLKVSVEEAELPALLKIAEALKVVILMVMIMSLMTMMMMVVMMMMMLMVMIVKIMITFVDDG